jgi:hypothetical protein
MTFTGCEIASLLPYGNLGRCFKKENVIKTACYTLLAVDIRSAAHREATAALSHEGYGSKSAIGGKAEMTLTGRYVG